MSNTPWSSVPKLWKDEKAYLNWLRSQVRKVWSRHPVKNNYVKQRPSKNPHTMPNVKGVTTKSRTCRQCEICNDWFIPAHLEVDHIHGGKGFSTYDEFLEWQKRILFVGFDDIREICKGCHADVNLMQRFNCTKEEVPYHKARIEFSKLNSSEQTKRLEELQLGKGKNKVEREALFDRWNRSNNL